MGRMKRKVFRKRKANLGYIKGVVSHIKKRRGRKGENKRKEASVNMRRRKWKWLLLVVVGVRRAGYSSGKVPFALKSIRLVLRPTPFSRLNRRNTESRMPLLLLLFTL